MSPQKRKSSSSASELASERPIKRLASDGVTTANPSLPTAPTSNMKAVLADSTVMGPSITPSEPKLASSTAKNTKIETQSKSDPGAGATTVHSPDAHLPPSSIVSSMSKPAAPTPPSSSSPPISLSKNPHSARMERYKSLQMRHLQSSRQNLADSAEEQRRLATDPGKLAALTRKHAVASQKLVQMECAEAGEDFERRRAWDHTIEESERWDRRMQEKEEHRREAGFHDNASQANKAYGRQVREMHIDRAAYEKDKMDIIMEAAKRGDVELIQTDAGEFTVIQDGTSYAMDEYGTNRPDKAGIERLVSNLKKADAERLKKRRKDRAKLEDDGSEDVTYINIKNKQFNDKLRRFYDKYTVGIRESFERGTAV